MAFPDELRPGCIGKLPRTQQYVLHKFVVHAQNLTAGHVGGNNIRAGDYQPKRLFDVENGAAQPGRAVDDTQVRANDPVQLHYPSTQAGCVYLPARVSGDTAEQVLHAEGEPRKAVALQAGHVDDLVSLEHRRGNEELRQRPARRPHRRIRVFIEIQQLDAQSIRQVACTDALERRLRIELEARRLGKEGCASRRPHLAPARTVRTVTIGRLRHADGWNVCPQAMRRLHGVLANALSLAVEEKAVSLDEPIPKDIALLWLTGTRVAVLSKPQAARLKEYVANGGTLFADPAAGRDEKARLLERGGGVSRSIRPWLSLS